ncbi:MAG: GtrA family protein [Rhodopila sp.]|nr:GtrA family protein [Rhodopila sp.]
MVGAICAVAHNVVMILGDWGGGHYVPVSVLSFGVVTPLGYLLHAKFTFMERLSLAGLLRFTSGVAAGFPLSLLVMATLCTGLGMPVLFAAPIATITLFLWNYASAHWAILGRWKLH